MLRPHLFELEDQAWLPHSLRSVVTQTLQQMIVAFRVALLPTRSNDLVARVTSLSGTADMAVPPSRLLEDERTRLSGSPTTTQNVISDSVERGALRRARWCNPAVWSPGCGSVVAHFT